MKSFKGKVLFVDDERNILKAIQREFYQTAFQIITAQSAKEALDIIKKETIDIIISDIKMPEMDGLQLLQIIKKKHPLINRIILSGYVEQSAVVSSIIEGIATSYLTKPWNSEELHYYINHILDIKKHLKEKKFLSVLNLIDNLPAHPDQFKKMSVAIKQGKTINELTQIIENDICITAKILQVANSAFYSTEKVTYIKRALINIGIDISKDIINVNPVITQFEWKDFQIQYFHKTLKHSSNVQYATNELLKILGSRMNKIQLTSVGLTHDIGKIILIQYFPERLKKTMDYQEKHPEKNFYECESQLGYNDLTHAEIGAYFMNWWNLPEIYAQTARYHHSPKKASKEFQEICSIIKLADELVNQITKGTKLKEINYNQLSSKLFKVPQLKKVVQDINKKINS